DALLGDADEALLAVDDRVPAARAQHVGVAADAGLDDQLERKVLAARAVEALEEGDERQPGLLVQGEGERPAPGAAPVPAGVGAERAVGVRGGPAVRPGGGG